MRTQKLCGLCRGSGHEGNEMPFYLGKATEKTYFEPVSVNLLPIFVLAPQF
jgi:hypothetical protein